MDVPCVLIAQPARANGNPEYLRRAEQLAAAVTWPNVRRVVWPNRVQPQGGEPRYRPHAVTRNEFIRRFLTDGDDYVLWIDVDVVWYPPDIVEQLLAVADDAIVGARPYVELRDKTAAPSIDNGGWFYDIGGFQRGGRWADMWRGFEPGECDSVGTCYIVPADLYRAGLRYLPTGSEVEHVSFCRQARERGTRVIAAETRVEHAFLPDYGERWR